MRKVYLLIFPLLVMSLFSCKKDRADTDLTAASDNAFSEIVFMDIFRIFDKEYKQLEDSLWRPADTLFYDSDNCVTSTLLPFDTSSFPKSLTIDFYGSNCDCSDGKERSGSITGSVSGRYQDSGTIVSLVLAAYYVNGESVSAEISITNEGRGGLEMMIFTMLVSNTVIQTAEGPLSWNGNWTLQWNNGEVTWWPLTSDDTYMVFGTSSGTTGDNVAYVNEIISPLNFDYSCNWFTVGLNEIGVQGLTSRTVDYGSGDCDNIAEVKINNVAHPLQLK